MLKGYQVDIQKMQSKMQCNATIIHNSVKVMPYLMQPKCSTFPKMPNHSMLCKTPSQKQDSKTNKPQSNSFSKDYMSPPHLDQSLQSSPKASNQIPLPILSFHFSANSNLQSGSRRPPFASFCSTQRAQSSVAFYRFWNSVVGARGVREWRER